MQISFSTLFSVSLLHDYFVTGETPDLSLAPTAATQGLMRRHQLRWVPNRRQNPTGWSCAARTQGAALATPLPASCSLWLWMRVGSPRFTHTTFLPPIAEGFIWHIPNAAAPDDTLNPAGAIRPVFRRFSYTVSGPSAPTLVEAKDASGAKVATAQVSPGAVLGTWAIAFDLSMVSEGMFTIAHSAPYAAEDHVIYNSLERIPTAAFALVEIVKGAAAWDLPLATPRAFTCTFSSRSTVWRYFVVRRGTSPFAIQDQATGAVAPYPWPIHFVPYASVGYTLSPEDEATLAFLQQAYPAGTVVDLFVSATAASGGSPLELPFYELPRKNIALIDTDAVGTAIMRRHLPVPSPLGNRAEVILCLETQHAL